MNLKHWLGLAAALSGGLVLSGGQAGGPADGPLAVTALSYYEFQMEYVGLNDPVRIKVRDLIQARENALAAWDAANGPRLAALNQAWDEADEIKEDARIKDLEAQILQLQTARAVLGRDKSAEALALLTPGQKAKWLAMNDCLRMLAGSSLHSGGTGGGGVRTWRGGDYSKVIIPGDEPQVVWVFTGGDPSKLNDLQLDDMLAKTKKHFDDVQKTLRDLAAEKAKRDKAKIKTKPKPKSKPKNKTKTEPKVDPADMLAPLTLEPEPTKGRVR
jgi:hypothetical protein